MFKWSYSTNGLTELTFEEAVHQVDKQGFEGVELSFQEEKFDPFKLKDEDLFDIKDMFGKLSVKPVCISTATTFFLSDIAHEPSLLSIDHSKQRQRIDLIKRGINIANKIGIPVVSFQSGYLREEHTKNSSVNPRSLLTEGIKECLKNIGDVTLVIEPEPGMYIETLKEAVELIEEINHPKFRLHIDICHAYCTEKDYVRSMEKYMNYTEYMHLADIKDGYSLKFCSLPAEKLKNLDLDQGTYLISIENSQDFLFVCPDQQICFSQKQLSEQQSKHVNWCLNALQSKRNIEFVKIDAIDELNNVEDFDIEIKAYLDSISGIGLDVLKEAVPILKYLRGGSKSNGNKAIISEPICNTINGKVHYHEVPGNGKIDFGNVLKMLKANYHNYITVELYNHSSVWQEVLPGSKAYLLNCMKYEQDTK